MTTTKSKVACLVINLRRNCDYTIENALQVSQGICINRMNIEVTWKVHFRQKWMGFRGSSPEYWLHWQLVKPVFYCVRVVFNSWLKYFPWRYTQLDQVQRRCYRDLSFTAYLIHFPSSGRQFVYYYLKMDVSTEAELTLRSGYLKGVLASLTLKLNDMLVGCSCHKLQCSFMLLPASTWCSLPSLMVATGAHTSNST